MISVASHVRGRYANGLPAGFETGEVGTVRTGSVLLDAGIDGYLSEAVHLRGLDPPRLSVPYPAHSPIAEPGQLRDPRERGFHVLAEPYRAGDQLDELPRLGLGAHAILRGLGRSSRELG